MHRPRRKPSYQRLYQEIKDRVIAFEFPQGERIYLERLAEEHGISTWPVRQVLDQLAAEGLAIKAPRKGYYAMKLNEEEVTGWYLITRHLLSLALETLDDPARQSLAESELLATELTRLNGSAVPDASTLASTTARTFERIAGLTGKPPIVEMIGRTNERLFYLRTLECQRLDGVRYELTALCELLLGEDIDAVIAEIKDYHDRRLRIVPDLIELSQR